MNTTDNLTIRVLCPLRVGEREARLTERVILQDLIAELRAYADEGYIMGASTVRELCTRVEEDLRECVQ